MKDTESHEELECNLEDNKLVQEAFVVFNRVVGLGREHMGKLGVFTDCLVNTHAHYRQTLY